MVDKKIELEAALDPIEPPSRGGGKSSKASKGTASSKKGSMSIADLRQGLKSAIEFVGISVMALDQFDGEVIHDKAGDMADCLIEVAKTNDKFRVQLEAALGISVWGGVLTVFGAQVALPIAVHHGLLPEPMNGFMAEAQGIPVKGRLKAVDDNVS